MDWSIGKGFDFEFVCVVAFRFVAKFGFKDIENSPLGLGFTSFRAVDSLFGLIC